MWRENAKCQNYVVIVNLGEGGEYDHTSSGRPGERRGSASREGGIGPWGGRCFVAVPRGKQIIDHHMYNAVHYLDVLQINKFKYNYFSRYFIHQQPAAPTGPSIDCSTSHIP